MDLNLPSLYVSPHGQVLPGIFLPCDWASLNPDTLIEHDPEFTLIHNGNDELLYFYDEPLLLSLCEEKGTANLYNGDTFILKEIVMKPQLKLVYGQGKYFDMIATCVPLQNELDQWRKNQKDERELYEFLNISAALESSPCRVKLVRFLTSKGIARDKIIYNGLGRSAAIGVSVLHAFISTDQGQARDQGLSSYYITLSKRSSNTATDAKRFHVLPAFIFQPFLFADHKQISAGESDLAQSEDVFRLDMFSVQSHIVRELMEEMFAFPDLESFTSLQHYHQKLDAFPPMIAFLQCVKRKAARMYATGIVVDLRMMRAELTYLMVLSDPTWGSVVRQFATAKGESRFLTHVPATSILCDAKLSAMYGNSMPPQGAIAMFEGCRILKEILNDQANI